MPTRRHRRAAEAHIGVIVSIGKAEGQLLGRGETEGRRSTKPSG